MIENGFLNITHRWKRRIFFIYIERWQYLFPTLKRLQLDEVFSILLHTNSQLIDGWVIFGIRTLLRRSIFAKVNKQYNEKQLFCILWSNFEDIRIWMFTSKTEIHIIVWWVEKWWRNIWMIYIDKCRVSSFTMQLYQERLVCFCAW